MSTRIKLINTSIIMIVISFFFSSERSFKSIGNIFLHENYSSGVAGKIQLPKEIRS